MQRLEECALLRQSNTFHQALNTLLTANVQAAGHKLRLRIPDTAVIESNVLRAWLYTDKQTGVLQATSRTQLSTAALLHKLQGQHAAHAVDNPHGWVAVAYFANCITRLVTAEELEELVSAAACRRHKQQLTAFCCDEQHDGVRCSVLSACTLLRQQQLAGPACRTRAAAPAD